MMNRNRFFLTAMSLCTLSSFAMDEQDKDELKGRALAQLVGSSACDILLREDTLDSQQLDRALHQNAQKIRFMYTLGIHAAQGPTHFSHIIKNANEPARNFINTSMNDDTAKLFAILIFEDENKYLNVKKLIKDSQK